MENWQYHATYSDCTQGGIVSPVLANIYLNELNKFTKTTAEKFYKQKDGAYTKEYNKISGLITKIKKQLKTAKGWEKTDLLRQLKALKSERMKTPRPKPIK